MLTYPEHCPTCSSPSPELHPAMQLGGEVQPCSDPWHQPRANAGADERRRYADLVERGLIMVEQGHSGNYQGPGLYRHYKGGQYRVMGLALHESRLYRLVIYEPLTPGSKLHGTPVKFWARPEDDFNEMVEREHGPVPRFQLLELESLNG